MANNFRKPNSQLWVGTATVCALMLLAFCPRNTSAQSNTFPLSGNAGVGTTTPSTKLEVVGNVNAKLTLDAPTTTAFRHIFNGSSAWLAEDSSNSDLNFGQNLYYNSGFKYRVTGTSANIRMYLGAFQFQTAASGSANAAINWTDAMVISANGNVGIGTSSPANLFTSDKVVHISSASNPHLRITDTSNTVNTFLDSEDTSGNIGTASNHNFNIFSNNLLRMTVANGGNIGIGTTTPSSKLDVAGNINSSGTITGANIIAKYQDVAEWVESSQSLLAGTVVVLDHTRSNQVIASSQAYDTRVAGVISAQPGITLGEKGESKVLVATTGRVKIKVDATAGPIQIGDLLVTSGKNGLAMKSQSINIGGVQIHRPGTLIGKALEPLASGTGEILVLLSLQ